MVIDETYIEYVESAYSIEKNISSLQNIMVIKSMSKVYGLSGARVAYLVGDSDYIRQLNGFIPPWSVSSLAQLAGIEALKNPEYYKPLYQKTHIMRNNMISALRKHDNIRVYDSVANFFLVQLLDEKLASDIFETLLNKQVFVRNCDSMSCQFKNKFLRIAVKNEVQNSRIIEELTKLL